MITGKAKLAGVIGWPISHSLSPTLHQYWLDKYAIDGAYVPIATEQHNFAEVLKALPKMGFAGVNITVPHKEEAYRLCDKIDSAAKACGAVNTVVFKDGKIHGHNTDVYGFTESIKSSLPAKNKALVIGAGGAARAVCYALKEMAFKEVIIVNRTTQKAEELTTLFNVDINHTIYKSLPFANISEHLLDADLLVNTTTVGMSEHDAKPWDISNLPHTALVYDVIYNPPKTALLMQAENKGNPIINGLDMLMHQARPGFEMWFGQNPEIDEALVNKLRAVSAK